MAKNLNGKEKKKLLQKLPKKNWMNLIHYLFRGFHLVFLVRVGVSLITDYTEGVADWVDAKAKLKPRNPKGDKVESGRRLEQVRFLSPSHKERSILCWKNWFFILVHFILYQ